MATYTTLRNGSKGDEVKKLQQSLIDAGYNVGSSGADGIYGNNTAAAVKAYQKANGLSVDGIAGNQTLGKLYGGSTATTTTPQANTSFQYQKFEHQDPSENELVKQANALLQQHMANQPGEYQSNWQTQLNDTLNQILNREEFSYDLNGDALYQQYKDQAVTQGKMASADVMGQAATMTGGYGNSYAQSVGQQAYQGYLQQLNDKVPELYQLALNQYNQEEQNLYNQASLMAQMDEQDYGRYRDSVSDYYTNLDYLTGRADTEYNKALTEREQALNLWADKQQYDYQTYRDAIADEQWQKSFDEGVRQYNESLAASKASSSKKTTDEDEDEDVDGGYIYEETPAVTNFIAKIRTKTEFARGSNADKTKYKTYEAYVKGMLKKYESELTDDEVAAIVGRFGLEKE
jgi:peptidoglycan hydrolase-like protein with peptidoglycan-binding domain